MGHLTKWLFFNLMFGAIPYALTVALNRTHSPGSPLLHPSSEVLFIAVVASSTALGELWDRDENRFHPAARGRPAWQLLMLASVLASSLLYGAYAYATLSNPGRAGGVDCLMIAGWVRAGPRDAWQTDLLSRWGTACTPWARTQGLFFRCSLWLTAWCVVMSTAAMYKYPSRRW
jgi:hypothetical protein